MDISSSVTSLNTNSIATQDLNRFTNLLSEGSDKNETFDKRITAVAEEFESVFISMMLKEMRNTLDDTAGGLFGSDNSDTYGGMFDMLMGQALSKGRHMGIADSVEKDVARYKMAKLQNDIGQAADARQLDIRS